MTRLKRTIQNRRAQLYNKFAAYDIEALVGVSLLGVVVIWLIWVMVFKP